MEYSINIYSTLLKEIASLSFDPYPLSHEDLSEITRIRTLLTSSLPSKPDEIISSLCMESEKKLRFEYEAALSAQQKRKENLSDIYNTLLDAFSCFLSTPPFNKTLTVWFSPLTENERNALKEAILVFTSKCTTIQTKLIVDAAEEQIAVMIRLQKELLARKIALLLSFPNQKKQIIEKTDRLSDLATEIESIKQKKEEISQAALRVAVDLLPPFLEDLHPVLVSLDTDSSRCADTTDVRRLFLNAEGIREQIRQTVEPITK